MKRKQKRYESEQEILDAIDRAHERIAELKRTAVTELWLVDNCAAEQKRTGEGCYDHDHQGKADTAFRSIERLENQKIPKLGQALAAFRTQTMPFCGEDKGVVLQ